MRDDDALGCCAAAFVGACGAVIVLAYVIAAISALIDWLISIWPMLLGLGIGVVVLALAIKFGLPRLRHYLERRRIAIETWCAEMEADEAFAAAREQLDDLKDRPPFS
jgi:hypothetical protein